MTNTIKKITLITVVALLSIISFTQVSDCNSNVQNCIEALDTPVLVDSQTEMSIIITEMEAIFPRRAKLKESTRSTITPINNLELSQ